MHERLKSAAWPKRFNTDQSKLLDETRGARRLIRPLKKSRSRFFQ